MYDEVWCEEKIRKHLLISVGISVGTVFAVITSVVLLSCRGTAKNQSENSKQSLS